MKVRFLTHVRCLRFPLLAISAALVLTLTQAAHSSAATTDPVGGWVGGYEIDGEWTFVDAHFEERGGELLGSLDFRFDMTTVNFVSEVTQRPAGSIAFVVEKEGLQLTFTGAIHANQFIGEITVGEAVGSFSLRRVYKLDHDTYKAYIGNYQAGDREHESDAIVLYSLQDFLLFRYFDTAAQREVQIYPLSETRFFSELGDEITITVDDAGRGQALLWRTLDGQESVIPRSSSYLEEEIRYPFGDITLAGTLLLPPTPGPHPAVVLMHGTNPNNRDYFRRWGHYFVSRGIAALVYDKPGAFDSAHPSLPSYQYNSVYDLANAAVAGVHYLQSRAEIHPEQVGIWTFSNSSWAGPVAASTSDDVAFLIGNATSGVAQRQADVFQDDLNNISYYDYPTWAANAGFEYLRFTREFSIFARDWNLPIPAPVRDYYGQDFDPLTVWAAVTQPILVINGQYDTLVDPVDAVARIEQTLQQSNHTDYTLVVYPDADHGLRRTETGLSAEGRGRRDRVNAPGVTEMMTEWVLARFDGQQRVARQVQAVQSPVPVQISTHFEPGGRYELLPWYGRPLWQTFLLLLFVIVFGITVISLPIAAVVSRFRPLPAPTNGVQLHRILTWLSSLIGLVLIAGLVLTWVQIVHLHVGGLWGLSTWLNLLPGLSIVVTVLLAASLFLSWRNRSDSSATMILRTGSLIFNITSVLFIWYLGYWHLLIG